MSVGHREVISLKMSNSAKPNFVSENSARTVIFCGFATLLGIALILSNIDQSTSSRILAGILLGALLLALGAGMISIAIIGPKSKLQITWKQFATVLGYGIDVFGPSNVDVCLSLGRC